MKRSRRGPVQRKDAQEHNAVRERDRGCVGPRVGMPGPCRGRVEHDHVRASGGLGMKSPTVRTNLVELCSEHHRIKTEGGRIWRPRLIEYIRSKEGVA
jgi:hypothetical protein